VSGVHLAGDTGRVALLELTDGGVEEVAIGFYHAHRLVDCKEVPDSAGDAVACDIRAD
jgi:hypothetical protein